MSHTKLSSGERLTSTCTRLKPDAESSNWQTVNRLRLVQIKSIHSRKEPKNGFVTPSKLCNGKSWPSTVQMLVQNLAHKLFFEEFETEFEELEKICSHCKSDSKFIVWIFLLAQALFDGSPGFNLIQVLFNICCCKITKWL